MTIYFHSEVEDFISGLSKQTTAKVLRTIDLLEEFGHTLEMPHSKKIISDIFELRIRGKREVRILYTFRKKSAVLLHAFIKKSQKIPKREIEAALARLKELA